MQNGGERWSEGNQLAPVRGAAAAAAAAALGGDPDPEKSMSLEAAEQLGAPTGTTFSPSSALCCAVTHQSLMPFCPLHSIWTRTPNNLLKIDLVVTYRQLEPRCQ